MTYEDKTAVFDYYWSGMDAVMKARQNCIRHCVGRQKR